MQFIEKLSIVRNVNLLLQIQRELEIYAAHINSQYVDFGMLLWPT